MLNGNFWQLRIEICEASLLTYVSKKLLESLLIALPKGWIVVVPVLLGLELIARSDSLILFSSMLDPSSLELWIITYRNKSYQNYKK
jgi:hypothetical protein